MVLQDLGRRLNQAINSLNPSTTVDEQSLDALLKSVSTALLESDVNVVLVKRTRERVKQKVLPQLEEIRKKAEQHGQGEQALEGQKARGVIQQAIFDELVSLVDPSGTSSSSSSDPNAPPPPPVFNPVKGKTQVLMMVGLQGAGKTTTCTKLATHYSRRGLKVALVCADTFRAGAFDQLKQNAVRAKVPFFGSYTETDPVTIAQQGVQKFRSSRFDLIIVDTSGRHRQESELFAEMVQISEAVEPDMTLLVLDGAMGQAAEGQSRAFKEAAGFGGIVVTKLDGHAKGGGAISAVAATSTPILFLGTGEHQHDLEPFRPRPFISKLLGLGDMQSLVERAQEMALADPGRQERMVKRLQEGVFTVRDLKEQLNTIMGMGPLSNLTSMIPGMSSLLGGGAEQEAGKRMKRVQFIFDSMTAEELDSDGTIFRHPAPSKTSSAVTPAKGKGKAQKDDKENVPPPPPPGETDELGAREPHPRILRVARGSGTSVQEVEELLAQHEMFGKMAKRMGGKNGLLGKLAAGGGPGGRPGGLPGMGAGGAGGMPPLGPGGMPDLSKMSPSQMRAMQSMLPPGAREMMSRPGAMEQMQQMMSGMGGMGGLGGLANMMGGGGAGGAGGMGGLANMMGGGAGGAGGMGGMAEMMKGLMGGGAGR